MLFGAAIRDWEWTVAAETESKRGRSGGGLPATTPTSAPHVVIQSDRRARDPLAHGAPQTAWRLFGWFGLLLVVVGGSDILSQWYPPAFHSAEWEFGTAAVTIASLPLLTIGMTILLASFLSRAKREGVVAMGVAFLCLFLAVGAALVLFALDIPLALRSPPGPALTAIKKAIVRTAVMGFSYEIAYLAAVILSFRYVFGRIKDE